MKTFFKNILSTVIGMLIASLVTAMVFLGLIAAILQGVNRGTMGPVVDKSILHIRLSGELVDKHRPLDFDIFGDRSIFSEERTIGLFELTRAIEAAKTDTRISGMYIEMRNFEAGWAAVTALHRKIEEFKAAGKWVKSYGDTYDEKSYYLATAGTEIYVQPYGEIEFNGLSVSEPFIKGLLDKLELEPRVFRVGKFKAAIEPLILDKMSPENRKQNEDLIGDVWNEVRAKVAAAMKLEPTKVDEIAAGLTAVSAKQGKEAGLFTDVLFEDEVEKQLKTLTVGENEDLEMVSPGHLLRDARAATVLNGKGPKKVALIFAEGEIVSGLGSRNTIGSEAFRQDILEAVEDDDVSALVVRINSPGGDALASDVIWRELMVADKKIPVVISMGDVAASGGYYMASAGRFIYAEPTTITGSIGVFGIMFNTEKFLKNKTAVSFDRVVTHPYADIGSAVRPMTDFEAAKIQESVERVYTRFLDVVQEGRGYEKREDLESIAEGRIWSGTRAKELGLVDELGGLDSALKKAGEFAQVTDYKVEIYPKDSDPFMQFLERFSGDSVRSAIAEVLLGKQDYANLKAVSEAAQVVPLTKIEFKPGIYTRMMRDVQIR